MWKPSDPHLDVSLSLTHMQTGKRRLLAVLFYEITRREFCKKKPPTVGGSPFTYVSGTKTHPDVGHSVSPFFRYPAKLRQ